MIIYKTAYLHKQKLKKVINLIKGNKNYFTLMRNDPSNTLRNGEYKKNCLHIDLSSFRDPLYLDPQKGYACVESRMTFEAFCKWTLSLGWVAPVVPEFKTITMAGAVMGAALESSSYLYGQFSDCCIEYACLLGNGELVIASPEQNADLFYGLSASYGTLALLTSIKVQLIPAKKTVSLRCTRFSEFNSGLSFLKSSRGHTPSFLEAIAFSPAHMVVIEGNLSDRHPNSQLKRPWSQWYAQKIVKSSSLQIDLPLFDYLFRFDRGAFWMGCYMKAFFQKLTKRGRPQNAAPKYPRILCRLLFSAFFSSRALYRLWHQISGSLMETLFFVHDFYVPYENVEEALSSLLKKTEIFPVWLCPVKGTKTAQFLSPHYGAKKFVNVGLYGIPKSTQTIPQLSAELEKEIVAFGGRKMLYSFTYYDFDFFSKVYDLGRYNELRKKFYAETAFLHLYNKVTNKS